MVTVIDGIGSHYKVSGSGTYTASAQFNPAQRKYKSFVYKHHVDNKNIFVKLFDKMFFRHKVEIPGLKASEDYLEFIHYIMDQCDYCKNNKIKFRLQFENMFNVNGKLKLESNRLPVFLFRKRKDAMMFKLRQSRSNYG